MYKKLFCNIALTGAVMLTAASANAAVAIIDSLANRIPWDQNPWARQQGYSSANYLNQVNLTLDPGTYSFSYVAGAWNPWGQSVDCAPGGTSCNGWMNAVAFDTGPGSQITSLGTGTRWATPELALAEAQAQPIYTQTFASQTTLRLFIADSVYDEVGSYWWNQGSVTLNIATAPVPLPAAAWLLGSGLIGLVGVARRRTLVV